MFICKLGSPAKPRRPAKARKHKKPTQYHRTPLVEQPAVVKVRRNGRIVVLGQTVEIPQPKRTEAQKEDRYRAAIAQHNAKLQSQRQAVKNDFIGPRISKKQRKILANASQPSPQNLKPVLTYPERDAILKRLFNWDYQTYLQSELWKGIRRAVMHRDQGRCRKCNKKASEVHHADYNSDVLLGRQNRKLFSLCRKCHITAEFDSNTGRKRSLQEANRILDL